ncbi:MULTISPECIES: hypothetical protein [Chryseobacterium]|uniref:hypothetical protein n=1 Tax=Chryseobacterium TaxID=59732 RepID=UPI000A722DB8|nr:MULTISPECIES: hypothetical protein [Chryseobacterium]MCL8536040.1 hypothetical protein [Chryseobacterium gallinarum]
MSDFNINSEENKNISKGETKPNTQEKKKKEEVKFPEWDVLPPGQIINPRIKNQ